MTERGGVEADVIPNAADDYLTRVEAEAHLQFEAMLTAARESTNPFDFALVCLLGLLGLRIFETVGADIVPTVALDGWAAPG